MIVQSMLMFCLTILPADCSTPTNTRTETWEGYLHSQLSWAHQQPWTFLIVILLLLSPCFGYSAMLSIRLNQQIQDISHKKLKVEEKKTN